MSRYYQLDIFFKGLTSSEVMNYLKLNCIGSSVRELLIGKHVTCKLYLHSGETEQEAHERISKGLKALKPDVKIKTRWTYLEDLPYTDYGDNLE